MRTYEVFLKKPGREEFRHAGSLEAPDPEMGLLLARETHSRRGEGAEMWLVERSDVIVGDETHLSVNDDRPHRQNDGALVAEHRKAQRGGGPGAATGATDPSHGSLQSSAFREDRS